MEKCPSCNGHLNISDCDNAQLLYCKHCHWGLISFSESVDSLMDFGFDSQLMEEDFGMMTLETLMA